MQEAADISAQLEELERLRIALTAIGDAVYEWDLQSDALTWFPGAEEALGIDVAQVARSGAAFGRLVHADDVNQRRQRLSRLDVGGNTVETRYRIALPNGTGRWVHDRARIEFGEDDRPIRLTGVIRVSGIRAGRPRIAEDAPNYDALTGLYTRSRLREALDHALEFSRRYDLHGAYLVVGLDNLTILNQALGHDIADTILMAVADRIEVCTRASDVVGRIGGDQFGVLLNNVPEAETDAAAEKILSTMREKPIVTADGPVYVTASIGAVPFPGAASTALDIMRRAEVALQSAKQAGRDCAVTYALSEEQIAYHRDCVVVAERVQRALGEPRMQFAYQPIVDAVTREPILHECLLRLVEADGEVVPAARFMPVVEDLGMIRSVDRAVLERGVDVLSRYRESRIAINVSGLTTTDRSWMRSTIALLHGRPDIAERMVVEITETAGLEDLEACCHFVATLRDLGCRVALDDFGAGYTSFRHLKSLAVNIVKIDGSFVRNIVGNPDNLVFVRTLIDLARTFNLETVAECVETQSEAELLTNEGVRYLQGYAFGYPDMTAPWQENDDVDRPAQTAAGSIEISKKPATGA